MVDETQSSVKSHTLGMRIQKKILGKMASRSVARHFIDDDAGRILDILYTFLKVYKNSRHVVVPPPPPSSLQSLNSYYNVQGSAL